MEVEMNPEFDAQIGEIFEHLVNNDDVYFKNQQRNESDLNADDKRKIAGDVFRRSKSVFLTRYGKHLKRDHLEYFKRYAQGGENGDEIALILNNLIGCHSANLRTKNRRYEALKRLISENSYFNDVEMMKRNPLLYEQLVGQYLSEDERRQRDRDEGNNTLVKILMEGIERDQAHVKMKIQEEEEDNAMEEEEDEESDGDSSETDNWGEAEAKPSTSRWGEFSDMKDETIRKNVLHVKKETFITAQERQLFRAEFTSLMYQNFLDGLDDFDYTTVDNNEEYDNIELLEHDEEDKYFDSEEPEDEEMGGTDKKEESSEDELDIYMNALNQHPAVCKLSKELEKL